MPLQCLCKVLFGAHYMRSSCAVRAHRMRTTCAYYAHIVRMTILDIPINKANYIRYAIFYKKTSQKYNAIYVHLQAIYTIFVLFNLGNIYSKQMPMSDDIGTHIFIIISYSFVGTTRTGQLELLISDVKNGRKRSVKNAPVFITSIATISAFVSRSASIN